MSNGGIQLSEEQFDELSLESKLGVLFGKAVKNGELLLDIREQCRCRQASCDKEFALYKQTVQTEIDKLAEKTNSKNIIERSLAVIAGTVGGFFSGKLG